MSKRKPNTTNDIFWQSDEDNVITYVTYVNRLCELAATVYEWKGLPDTIDSRFLEMGLMARGYMLYFRDEVIGDLCLPCTIGGKWNVYNIPIERYAYASNGYYNHKTEKDSVIIYNNMLHTNEMPAIVNYAKRLYLIDRTIDINVNAQKTPVLLIANQDQQLTLKNLYQKYDGNSPFIFGDKQLNANTLQAINTGAPYVAGNLYELRTNIWNEALTFLGIPNIAIQKKERMLKDEINRNNGGTISSSYGRLQARKQAADQINKMFGTSITVDLRYMDSPHVNPEDTENDESESEGDNNE